MTACARIRSVRTVVSLVAALAACVPAGAVETIFSKADPERRHEGRILVEAQDGGVLFQDRAGAIADYQPEDILRRETSDATFAPFDKASLGAGISEEFGPAFHVHETEHYVIVYDTHPLYARWAAGMLEKLHAAFYAFWKREGIELVPPEFPLPVLLFRDKPSYVNGTRSELGEDAGKLVSFYSLKSNRVYAYDVTEFSARSDGARFDLAALRRPEMIGNVTNLIHEATHQIAFNSGLQTRFADHPLWYSEGLAMYFEAPDFGSGRGWRSVGAINLPRIVEFRKRLDLRKESSLATMVSSNDRFRDPLNAPEAYADAWSFVYWAFKRRSKEMTEFARAQQQLEPLTENTPEERLAQFRAAFGEDLTLLDREFVKAMAKMR